MRRSRDDASSPAAATATRTGEEATYIVELTEAELELLKEAISDEYPEDFVEEAALAGKLAALEAASACEVQERENHSMVCAHDCHSPAEIDIDPAT